MIEKRYYTFDLIEEAEACITAINTSGWFPLTGKIKGEEVPEKQKTELWQETPLRMSNGKFGVLKIPDALLDSLGVTQNERDAFNAMFDYELIEYEL